MHLEYCTPERRLPNTENFSTTILFPWLNKELFHSCAWHMSGNWGFSNGSKFNSRDVVQCKRKGDQTNEGSTAWCTFQYPITAWSLNALHLIALRTKQCGHGKGTRLRYTSSYQFGENKYTQRRRTMHSRLICCRTHLIVMASSTPSEVDVYVDINATEGALEGWTAREKCMSHGW